MTERFNVAGALLVKLFGRPGREEPASSPSAPAGSATSACSIAHVRPGLLRRAHPGRLAGDRAGLRRRRRPGRQRHAHRRHPGRPGRPARPALRPAHRAVQRPGRRHDRAGVASSGSSRCSTCEPLVAETPGRRRRCPHGPLGVEFDDVSLPLPVRRRGVARLAGVGRRPATGAPSEPVLHDVTLRGAAPGSWSRSSARPAPARPRSPRWSRGSTTRREGAVRVGGRRRPRRDPGVAARRRRRRHPGRAPVPRHDPGQPAYARPDATEARAGAGAARPPRSGTWSPRCPTGLDTVVGDRGLPALRRREAAPRASPGCCSRPRRSSCSTRRPPTSTPSPRPPSSARSTTALAGPDLAGHRPPAVDRPRTPTRSSSSTTAGSSSAARTTSCSPRGGLYADLYRTQFAEQGERRRAVA